MPFTWNRLFGILALVLFILAALAGGGVITMAGSGWLIPGGLASLTLSMLIP